MDLIQLPLEGIMESLKDFGPRLIGALLIVVLGYVAAKVIVGSARRAMRRTDVDQSLVQFFANVLQLLLMGMVAIAAVGKIGVESASFAAVVATLGLAIGLAFKDTLSNFASGVIILALKSFRVGDVIEIGNVVGTVEELNVFATEIRTPDNKRVVIPNALITDNSMINYTAHQHRRIDLVVEVDYTDDLALVKQTLQEVLDAEPRLLDDPEPLIAVLELADSGVKLIVRPWALTDEYWAVRLDLTEAIKLAFDDKGITIPYPQHEVHLRSGEGATGQTN